MELLINYELRIMNFKLKRTFIYIYGLLSLFIVNSCSQEQTKQANAITKVRVKAVSVKKAYLPDYIELTGKTIYLNKSSLVSPISGYITSVNIRQGDVVTKGKLLFEIQTPEAFAMKKDSSASNYGTIKVYAPSNGRIVNLNIVNTGVFTDKGSVMCILLASNDLKLQVSVPFEYNQWAKIGNSCKVILPDNTEINGTFSKILPQINEKSQTVKVLANINTSQFLPENMIVKVLLDKSEKHQAQILPKICLQTDALMSNFWVLKLINDSTAVQVPVTVGNQTHNKVEILTPEFNAKDLIVSEGAYGLSDTVLIDVN